MREKLFKEITQLFLRENFSIPTREKIMKTTERKIKNDFNFRIYLIDFVNDSVTELIFNIETGELVK